MSSTNHPDMQDSLNSQVVESSWNNLPRELLESLVKYLSYSSLLNSRRVCREWNSVIMDGHFPSKTILHVLPNPSCKYWKKQLGKPSLIPNLTCKWSILHVHNLKQSIPIFKFSTNYIDFSHVTSLTLHDGDFTPRQLVSKMLSKMINLHHFSITEGHFTGGPPHFPYDSCTLFQKLCTMTKDWKLGLETIQNLETCRIGTDSLNSAVVYLKLMTVPKSGSLKTISLDFSKIQHLPFNGSKIENTYNLVADLVALNAGSLVDFKLQWAHCVETDTEISIYEEEEEKYFFYFLEMLGSTKWPTSERLQLRTLEVVFPRVSFWTPLVESALIPFLQKQTALTHFLLTRIRMSDRFVEFNTKLANLRKTLKREYGVYIDDLGIFVITVPSNKAIVGIELYIFWCQSIFYPRSLTRPWSTRDGVFLYYDSPWGPHVISLRICNAKLNSFFMTFNIPEIVKTFPNLRRLELLDERYSDETSVSSLANFKSEIGDEDFLLIVEYLPSLVSIKLSSLTKLTDSGLTGIKPAIVSRMKKLGNYHSTIGEIPVIPPLSKMKNLKYLELRNLTENVSDVSVLFGFQYIPRLEKVALLGEHEVTSWGSKVLEKKFQNNPRFAIYLKKSSYVPFNSTMISHDY